MDNLLTVHLPQSMASPSSEAGGGYHHYHKRQHYVLEKLGSHQFHHGALAMRVALVATCLVSLRTENLHWNASFTVYIYVCEMQTTYWTWIF